MIRIPVIKVYDKDYKAEHIVGTNHHDLLITDGETITYQNMQNCEGTQSYEDTPGTYAFTGKEFDGETHIEMMPLDEFLELYTKLAKEQNDIEEHFQKSFVGIKEQIQREEEIKSGDSYVFHT